MVVFICLFVYLFINLYSTTLSATTKLFFLETQWEPPLMGPVLPLE